MGRSHFEYCPFFHRFFFIGFFALLLSNFYFLFAFLGSNNISQITFCTQSLPEFQDELYTFRLEESLRLRSVIMMPSKRNWHSSIRLEPSLLLYFEKHIQKNNNKKINLQFLNLRLFNGFFYPPPPAPPKKRWLRQPQAPLFPFGFEAALEWGYCSTSVLHSLYLHKIFTSSIVLAYTVRL